MIDWSIYHQKYILNAGGRMGEFFSSLIMPPFLNPVRQAGQLLWPGINWFRNRVNAIIILWKMTRKGG
jgi:hypothetical protein